MTREITFTDWCCGVGGTRLALEAGIRDAGFSPKCLLSADKDKYCQIAYKANHGEEDMLGSPSTVQAEQVPSEHDIFSAGFPCQPFSLAGVSKKTSLGRAHGFEDPTSGTVVFELKRLIAGSRPRGVFLENVKNLVSHDKGTTMKVILAALRGIGYHVVAPRVFDAKLLLPQHRERVFIIAFREEEDFNRFQWPDLQDLRPRLRDILEPSVDPKYTLSDRLWASLQNHARKHREAGHGFGFGLADLDGVSRTLSARYYKDGSEILIPQEGNNPRRLTPRECARLQGFPDSFKLAVSDTQAYKQFGNSVPVPLLAAVVKQIVLAMPEKLN